MVCNKHPNRQAQGTCAICGQPFCEECLVDVSGTLYCKEHIAEIISAKPNTEHKPHVYNAHSYSNNGGTDNFYGKAHPHGGHAPLNHEHHYHDHKIYHHHYGSYPYKNHVVALLLCIFLGWGGIHRFYTGKIGTGLLWMFTGGFFGIGYIVDIICLAMGSFRDVNGYPLI